MASTRSLSTRLFAASALVLVGAAAHGGCSGTQPTEIVAAVTTQMRVPKELKSVGVLVQRGGQVVFCQGYPVVDGAVTLPATLAVEPAEVRAGEPLKSDAVTVTYYGFTTAEPSSYQDCVFSHPEPKDVPSAEPGANNTGKVGELRVMRRQRSPYAEDRVLFMPMPLREACAGVPCTGEDEACLGGVCTKIDVEPGTLVDYRPEFVFGESSTCFSLDRCVPNERLFAASLSDVTTCSFELPVPPDAKLTPGTTNVVVVYDSFGIEVLDKDPVEGFIVPDPAEPQKFRLSPNLCSGAYKRGRIMGVTGNYGVDGFPSCPSKTPYQPICTGELPGVQLGKLGDRPASKNLCVVPQSTLEPAESALYVLMDRAASMERFFNNDKLFQQAISFTISNPIAERTKVAFAFLPATKESDNACGTTHYADPTSIEPAFPEGFGLAVEMKDKIVDLFRVPNGSATNPHVSSKDYGFAIDDVLSLDNAYAALTKLGSAEQFNRRALLILTNRKLLDTCPDLVPPSVGDAASKARAALDGPDRIHTYVIPLPNSADSKGQDSDGWEDDKSDFDDRGERAAIASQIAAAGGTTFRDASTADDQGQLNGAQKLQEIVNDLGTCVYTVKPAIATRMSAAGVHLSYLNPITQERTDIPANAACSESTQDDDAASGWSLDGSTVRICGGACGDLRDALSLASLQAAQSGHVAPKVPILVSEPCSGG